MSVVFVSHRSKGYNTGVGDVVSVLEELVGAPNVLIDRTSFLPGAAWLPQLRAQVAMADIVICVIGPTWAAKSSGQRNATDFVEEELSIARQLRKTIVPIVISGDRDDLLSQIPEKLKWLKTKQMITFDSGTTGATDLLLEKLRTVVAVDPSNSAGNSNGEYWQAVFGLGRSFISPIAAACVAFKPTSRSFRAGLEQLLLSIGILQVVGFLMSERFSVLGIVRISLAVSLGVLVVFGLFKVVTKVLKTPIENISAMSFSMAIIATLVAAFSFWGILLYFAIPGEVHAEMYKRIADADGSFAGLEGWTPALSPVIYLISTAINLVAIAHLLFLAWGFARAASMVVGWRHWTSLLVVSLPAVAYVGLLGLIAVVPN